MMDPTPIGASPEYEEWRLSFVLPPGKLTTGELMRVLLAALPAGVAAHRKGRRGVRLYGDSKQLIEHAERTVRDTLTSHRLHAKLDLARWNPGEERWQSPLLPIDPPRGRLPESWSGLDEMAWEIRLRFDREWEADQLEAKLRERDAAVIGGWKRVLIGVADETTARQRASELRLAAPNAVIEVRPLSHWRRWMIRQKLIGNYAGRFDAFDGGAGLGVGNGG